MISTNQNAANHKNSGGIIMSLTKSATRRLSLFAGSSLVAASLASLAFTGATLAPTAALAYDECTAAPATGTLSDGTNGASDPGLNGAVADSFQCTAATYANGITYNSAGALTVTKTTTTGTTITANGINLVGTGNDAVTWNSAAGNITDGASTAGPLIDVRSVSGPISITTAGVSAFKVGTTHAIYAESTGGGSITITRASGTVDNQGAAGNGNLATIEATTNGGNVSITTNGNSFGRVRGILARTSGAGAVSISMNGGQSGINESAIEAVAGTGGLAITVNTGNINSANGTTIIGTSASAANLQNLGGTITGRVNFSGVTAGGVTFNNAGATANTGRWVATGASVFSGLADTLTLGGIGQNTLAAGATIDLAAGADTFNISGLLTTAAGTVNFGSGADALNVTGRLIASGTTLDFGSESDVFNLSGVLAANNMTITGLEAFNHSGLIYLGGASGTATDGAADDRLALQGTNWTASGDARIVMDVLLGAGNVQAGCATMTGVADCLYLPGGSTFGTTVLTLNSLGDAASQGGYDPVGITLVDVEGGSSAAGHFVLDPNSPNFTADPVLGGAIARPGLFVYALRYDPDTGRHSIVGLPHGEVMEYAMLGGAAQSIWHMTSETVTDRQNDLRAGTGKTVWLRTTGEYTKRDIATEFETGGGPLAVDNSYKLYAGTIMAGRDFVTGQSGDYNYVLGGQIGYVGSGFELEASPSTGQFTGATGGVYASYWGPRLFVDGTFHGDFLTLDYESPGLGSKTNTYVNSFGARMEGGTRFGLSQRTYLEPLASLAFARTSFEEISLNGGVVKPDDTQSRRAALGLRLGADYTEGAFNFGYFVTGRAWNEFSGQSDGVVENPGLDLPFTDEFSGSFGEAEAGLKLTNDAGTLSGFLSSAVKTKEGYDALNIGLGLRAVW